MGSPYATGEFADVPVDYVRTQSDLVAVAAALLAGLRSDPERWENGTLERFPDALGAVTADRPAVHDPTWQLVAELLVAATGYK